MFSLAVYVWLYSAFCKFYAFVCTIKTPAAIFFSREREQCWQLHFWVNSMLWMWLSVTHQSCCILSLGKQSDFGFVWFWAVITSPGRWSKFDWGSGRRLPPGRGSCRLGRETWSNRPLPGPAGPATSQTLRGEKQRSVLMSRRVSLQLF